MLFRGRTWAGLLFILAAAEFTIGLIIAEAMYPGYSVRTNYISDLGVGPSANVFNASVILLGVLAIIGDYIARKVLGRVLFILLLLTGIGAIGVGVFTEAFGFIHSLVSLIAFLFGGLSAVWSYRILKPPLSYLAIVFGLFGLVALGLYVSQTYLGLGNGGMERMIVYPILAWGLAFGGYLMTPSGMETT